MKEIFFSETINGTAFLNAVDKLNKMDNINDLRKANLSLASYRACYPVLKEISRNGKALSFVKEIADFFKKCGFEVSLSQDKINYIIE